MIRPKHSGFTLAEVLVALTIGTFISLVAVGTLKTVSSSAQIVKGASEKNAELRFAARMIARDLSNLYRDEAGGSMRLMGASQATDDTEQPAFLRFYAVGRTKARPAQPESDVYEVEYVLRSSADAEDDAIWSGEEPTGLTLYRRLWPNPDRNRKPGGILTPIAKGMMALLLRFYDGKEWRDNWPEELQSIPELIEVTLAMQTQRQGDPLVETFIVNFPRLVADAGGRGDASENGNGQGSPNGAPVNGQGPPPGGR